MMKCTMVFSLTTALSNANAPVHRTGGWSESHFIDNASFTQVRTLFEALCQERALLLPTGASITGQRYQLINPIGASQSQATLFPGASGLQTDVPQMALLCRVPTIGARNISRLTLRGIPDQRVVEGEYSPSQGFNTALRRFFTQLSSFRMEGRDLAAENVPTLRIFANGVYRTQDPNAFAVNSVVRVMRAVRDVDGRTVSGTFVVQTVVDTRNGTLFDWTGGDTRGGTMRLNGIAYPQLDGANAAVSRVVVKKVGRPSAGYRGRR